MLEIVLGILAFTAIVVVLALLVLAARRVLVPEGSVEITLNGGKRMLSANIGDKLFDALNADGIFLPSSCSGAGTCGLCTVRVAANACDATPQDRAILSEKALAAGARLACQVRLKAPLVIEVPEEVFGVNTWACTVTSTRNVATLIREIELKLPDGFEDERLRAGSFVEVTAPAYRADFADLQIDDAYLDLWQGHGLFDLASKSDKPVTRAYSIANAPSEPGKILLIVRIALPPPGSDAPPGVVSSWLFGLKVGDDLDVRGPFGHFQVDDSPSEAVFIGGGAGMAPMRAHLLDQLECRKVTRPISFWYGARSKRELFYSKLFDDLAAKHDNFDWTVALSDPEPGDDWDGATGYIHEVVYERLLKDHPLPNACAYYLCGPPMMIKAVRAMLDKLGVAAEQIHYDDFGND